MSNKDKFPPIQGRETDFLEDVIKFYGAYLHQKEAIGTLWGALPETQKALILGQLWEHASPQGKNDFVIKWRNLEQACNDDKLPEASHNEDDLVCLIAALEGYRERAYLCPANIPTIGFGRTSGVQIGQVTKVETELRWLKQYIEERYTLIEQDYPVLDYGEISACVSLSFNIGWNAFRRSTLAAFIRAGDLQSAAQQFERWVFGGSRRLPGLVARRKLEKTLFVEGWQAAAVVAKLQEGRDVIYKARS